MKNSANQKILDRVLNQLKKPSIKMGLALSLAGAFVLAFLFAFPFVGRSLPPSSSNEVGTIHDRDKTRHRMADKQSSRRGPMSSNVGSSLIEGDKLADLVDLFEVARKDGGNELERRQRMCRIVEKMVALGFYQEAKKIAVEFGDGVLRNGLIHSLFASNPENLDILIGRVGEPGFNEKDRLSIWTGIMQKLSGPDGPREVAALLASNKTLGIEETGLMIQGAIDFVNPGVLGASYWSDPSDLTTWPDQPPFPRPPVRPIGSFRGLPQKANS